MAGSGRKVLTVGFTAEGVDTVKKQIEDVGKAGQDAASKITSAFAKSNIGKELTARLNALKLKFADTVLAARKFGSAWAGVGKALNGFTESIKTAITRITKLVGVVGLAAFGVNKLMTSFGAKAENISQMAAALGVTTDQYQRLTQAAADAGIEQTKVETILAKFTIGVEDAGDASEKASKKNKDLGKSFEQIAVKAQDGSTKIVTIRRGVQDVSKDVDKFAGVTKTGVEGLKQYAASLAAAGGPAEQLQKASRDFGAKNAVAVVTYFKAVSFQLDDNARAAAGLIPKLSDLEILVGNDLDTSFDHLGENLSLIRDRLVAVFSPAYSKIVKALTFWIQDNEGALKDWAQTINDKAIVYIDDLISLLQGAPQKVKNKWLIDLYNGAIKFGEGVKYVFETVLPQAFNTLREYADIVAKKLNEIFGTNFTGDSLLVVIALGYVTGAFNIVIKTATLVGSTLFAVAQTFRLVSVSVNLLLTALRPLFFLVGYLGAALATFLGLPAIVGVAIVAALVIAGALIYAYWDDVKGYVFATWDAIVKYGGIAVGLIAANFGKLSTEWSAIWDKIKNGDWKGTLDEVAKQFKSGFDDLVKNTQHEIDLINDALKSIGIDLPSVWEHIKTGADALWKDIVAGASALGGQLSTAWESVKNSASELWAGVEATASTIWNSVATIITNAASGIAEAVGKVWTAAGEAISGATKSVFETASGILDSINKAITAAGDVQGAVDLAAKLVSPFTDARTKIEDVWTGLAPVLEAKGGDIAATLATAFDPVKTLPTAFSDAAFAIAGITTGIVANVVTQFGQLVPAAVQAATGIADAFRQVLAGATFGVDLSGIVSAFQNAAQTIVSVWGSAMQAISQQTASMVASVQALISSLASVLAALRAQIAAAKSQAASSPSDGGARGRAVGGIVSGPGTGISDSILSWLSNGEFVIKARAVKHWGLDALQALNGLRMPRFAAGGLVGEMASAVTPRGSGARPLDGAKSGLTPYTLVFEGKQFPGFLGPAPDTLTQLGKARAVSRISTPNRVPKWKG
jgi:phage-related protein